MTITTGCATKLNKMNRAAKDASLGTALRNLQLAASGSATIVAASGSYTVVAADASNAKVAITTGLTSVNGFVVQVRRSGSAMPFMAVTAGSVAGTIKVIKDPTYTGGSSLAADDVVTWFAF
jgi:hypothetical protein